MTQLIAALRTLASRSGGGRWCVRRIDGWWWLSVVARDGRTTTDAQPKMAVETDDDATMRAVATVLNTAIDLASLAFTVEEQARSIERLRAALEEAGRVLRQYGNIQTARGIIRAALASLEPRTTTTP